LRKGVTVGMKPGAGLEPGCGFGSREGGIEGQDDEQGTVLHLDNPYMVW